MLKGPYLAEERILTTIMLINNNKMDELYY